MAALLKRLYSTGPMLKQNQILGEIPSTREAYKRNFDVAWPSALEAVLVSLIASVDTIMVGGLGPHAITAVGITNQPKFVLLAVILSLNVGVTALVARRKGAEDQEGANRCLKQSILLCAAFSFIMTVLGFLFAGPIILFAGAQEDVAGIATQYFRIILVGNFFSSLGLTINAAQRGIGNTKISMTTNLVANAVNLTFNYLLIGGNLGFPRWEVAGAAVATVLGNIVAFLMSVLSVLHHNGFLCLTRSHNWHFDKETLGSLFRVGGSAMTEQVFMRIGFFSYVKVVANLGTMAFAAHQICMQIMNLAFSFGDGFGIATSSLSGRSLGSKRPDLAILYTKVGQRFAFTVSLVLACIFALGNTMLASLFTTDAQVIAMCRPLLYILAVVVLFMPSTVVFFGCLRGAGDTAFTAIISAVCIGLIRPGASWLLCYPLGLGLIGAWLGLLVDQLLRLTLALLRFRTGRWTSIRL